MTRLTLLTHNDAMRILQEFSRDLLAQAILVFDSSEAPRTEDLLIVLEEEFSLNSKEAAWLYDAIVCARPVMNELTSIRVYNSSEFTGSLDNGSRQYGDYTYVVLR